MILPVYRKYDNNQRFYKVLDDSNFHEIQVVGKRFQQYRITAASYPERLFINDLIDCRFEGITQITEDEFQNIVSELEANLEEVKPRQN